jgi:hypothetical protein
MGEEKCYMLHYPKGNDYTEILRILKSVGGRVTRNYPIARTMCVAINSDEVGRFEDYNPRKMPILKVPNINL